MPELMLLRHAKSEWNSSSNDDAERPLASRGVKAARLIGRFIADARRIPDLILCSPAERTRQTLELAIETGDWSAPVRSVRELYGASAEDVIAILRGVGPEDPDRLLLVGHEPWCSELIAALIGGGAMRFPTAAMALVEMGDTPWSALDRGCGKLRWLVTPKLLAAVM